MKTLKIMYVVGRRSDLVKIAPIVSAMRKQRASIVQNVVHAGEHLGRKMCTCFLETFEIPLPEDILSGQPGQRDSAWAHQMADHMMRFEDVFLRKKPDVIFVVGGSAYAAAAAIAAAKLDITLAHLEAGLRTQALKRRDEDDYQRMIALLCQYHFTGSRDATRNLLHEGIERTRVFCVGNVLVDTLIQWSDPGQSLASALKTQATCKNLQDDLKYGVMALHRGHHIKDPQQRDSLLKYVGEFQSHVAILLVLTPEVQTFFREPLWQKKMAKMKNVKICSPLNYSAFITLCKKAQFIVTDSSALQDEAAVLDVPCFILDETTSRKTSLKKGRHVLIGGDLSALGRFARHRYLRVSARKKHHRSDDGVIDNPKSAWATWIRRRGLVLNPLWDGCAADRVTHALLNPVSREERNGRGRRLSSQNINPETLRN